ncbi:MAG: hypothetical protein AUI11_12270 [Acidobacteria bacterium 13_2_20CM_2_66_4]|nr:MAG: hypothetical protein AUI11_12270 [Acidobacteria bacterium 13_2_20CM_2_66_4]
MRSAANVNGHPIHPMLVAFPAAYLFGSACVDLFARATGRRRWFRTASHLNALGIASALAAAIPGLIDYMFVVPPKSSAKNRATDHMFANLSALAMFALARAGRREEDQPAAPWAMAAEVAGVGLLTTGGWLGGTLVYRNQIGVDHRYANAGKWRVEAIAAPATTIDAAAVGELDVNQMKLVRAGSKRIVLARTERGHVAFDDRCTHKGGPLSDGTLACGVVQCPWHGSQFDVASGAVEQGPAAEGIHTYDVVEHDGRIYISVR